MSLELRAVTTEILILPIYVRDIDRDKFYEPSLPNPSIDERRRLLHISRLRRLVPFLQVIASFADSSAVLATAEVAVWVYQLIDLRVTVVFRGNDWNRKLPLSAISSLHDFANPKTAVMSWDVRLQTIS